MPMTAILAKTAASHWKGSESVVPDVLQKHPGMTLADTMTDADLLQFLDEEIQVARRAHDKVIAGDEKPEILRVTLEEFLLPNVAYLKQIRRLPLRYQGIDFARELAA